MGTLGVTMPVVCPLMDIAVVTAIFQYSGYYSVLKHNLLLVESFSPSLKLTLITIVVVAETVLASLEFSKFRKKPTFKH